ncbi:hypothetical protein G7Z17_g1731 [Cylindrodendrum hubeiense]|uniref:Uncharacterized protein n=1 Tax=Cylindrodendrum hubeiense TaxID=595255 RepID=A0A9P5LC91_9HYPO|nr:hypothetical protein G7Z17_g1731 [Cylindrodendrum hubeiense]
MNFTITVPKGSSNHSTPNLICTPPQATDYIVFFFTNYFAHAATVVSKPGQSLARTCLFIVLALILPGSGIIRALSAILHHASTEFKNPAKRAARAGALCMVVRKSKDMLGGPDDIGLPEQSVKMEACKALEKETGVELGPSVAKVGRQGSEALVEDTAADVSNPAFENKPPESREVDKWSVIITKFHKIGNLPTGPFLSRFQVALQFMASNGSVKISTTTSISASCLL